MRKLLMIGAVLAAVVVPTASQAQFTVGARLGYGFGMGNVGGSGATALKMSDWVKGQVPLQLDAMYRMSPEFSLGAYFAYGFGQTGTVCDGVSDCSGKDTRVGVQAAYAFTKVNPTFVPWAGLGLGYEWNTLKGGTDKLTFKGFDLALQAGGDYKVNAQFSVGPYAQFAIGQYDSGTINGTSADITDKSMHEWFSFGVRGKFDI